MENNTVVIDAITGEKTYTYVEPIELPEEEIPAINYDELVNEKIRCKYSASQELAILRQRDEKPDEFQEYFDYCEKCKQQVKDMYDL